LGNDESNQNYFGKSLVFWSSLGPMLNLYWIS
jgi:hypothetical protein